MTDPHAELARARIRYLSAFVRGEITGVELNKKLAMIDRSEKRLAEADERLERKRRARRVCYVKNRMRLQALRSLAQEHAP